MVTDSFSFNTSNIKNKLNIITFFSSKSNIRCFNSKRMGGGWSAAAFSGVYFHGADSTNQTIDYEEEEEVEVSVICESFQVNAIFYMIQYTIHYNGW